MTFRFPALPLLVLTLSAFTHAQSPRPAISGISHMSVYTSDPAATEHFYTSVIGAAKGEDPQDPTGTRFYLSPTQFVEVLPLPPQHGISRLARVSFSTSDAAGLQRYLAAHGVQKVSEIKTAKDGSRWFEAPDPEGNEVEFYQQGKAAVLPPTTPIGSRIIHVGYEVHDKQVEDRFFKEILGFRPYWFGAMHPGNVDWVSEQVPDGRDWLEYMMVGEGSGSPVARVDQRQLGVMNHFSIGVPNMEQAVTTLIAGDRLSPRHDGPQMGKDGKWQANLYDPDGTRVELMEFQAVTKPCCSPFTAESPSN